jgi:hypothetical protein
MSSTAQHGYILQCFTFGGVEDRKQPLLKEAQIGSKELTLKFPITFGHRAKKSAWLNHEVQEGFVSIKISRKSAVTEVGSPCQCANLKP